MSGGIKIAKSLSSTTTLNDGVVMPLFGFGSNLLSEKDVAVKAALTALKMGYRLLDTAQIYGNEAEIGQAVRQSGLPRDQVFVVTKLNDHGIEKTRESIKESLKRLDIGYIDLFLIHAPLGGKILETYDEILKFKKQGLIRSVGVSNFYVHHLEGLKKAGRPTPSVNQIELHVWHTRNDLVDYCQKNGITVMGYSPLGQGMIVNDKEITKLAAKYNKTNAQLLIRWSVQKGYITIPKSSKAERIEQNAQVFDFSISDEDMAALAGLTTWSCMQDVGYRQEDFARLSWDELA